MFNHIFKLIWKKRRSNFLLMLEIFISFIILFGVASLTVYNMGNLAAPAGLTADRVWAVSCSFNTDSLPLVNAARETVKRELLQIPDVGRVSFMSNNMPYSFSSSNNEFNYEGRSVVSEIMYADTDFPEVLGLQLSEGRWFTNADTVAAKYRPVVITRKMKEDLLGNAEAVGALLNADNKDGDASRVIGVVDYFKHKSDFQGRDYCVLAPLSGPWGQNFLVKTGPGATAETEARVARLLSQLGPNWVVEIQHLDEMKSRQNRIIRIPMLILYIVCAFLVFNVALGLFGVLFQNIQRRRAEIGLRRAMGATKSKILQHFVGETAMIATFGVALGLFFTVQFPLMSVFDVAPEVYFKGMFWAVTFIYLLVLICSVFPGKQAAAVQPATALHEE